MTAVEIFAAVALKGALFEFLRWKGLLPRYYLGEDAPARSPAKGRTTPEFFTDRNGNVWAVEEGFGEGALNTLRPAKR